MLERRRIGRTKVLKGARIVLNQRAAVVACVVHDLTNVGACIHVTDARSLPNGFDLALGNLHTRRRCTVIWTEVDRVGVAFV